MISTDFVGRRSEIQTLRTMLDTQTPGIAVIYGRRRIGKSALIRKALEGRPAVYFEGLEGQGKQKQIRNFLLQLDRQISIDVKKVSTWSEAFLLLLPALRAQPACIVLDEFQWIANYGSEIVAELKMVWDQYFCHIPGVSMILCGSIASYMTTKVIRSKALYGRTDHVLNLREFRLDETK
jgi:AAA+ ATPase superfamily predicted ATPase